MTFHAKTYVEGRAYVGLCEAGMGLGLGFSRVSDRLEGLDLG